MAIVSPYPRGHGLAKTPMRQLFAVMTAVQISPEILLTQMRESSVYYHRVIDSDKCSGDSNVSMMKELAAKPSIMLPLIKSPGEPQPTNGAERAPRILIPIAGVLQRGRAGRRRLICQANLCWPLYLLSGILHN